MEVKTSRGPAQSRLRLVEEDGSQRPTVIWADFFARFRFNLEELITYLRAVSGKTFAEAPFAYQSLDDLGYWSLVRNNTVFELTAELEASIRSQFKFLELSYDYQSGDRLIWGDMNKPDTRRFLVKLLERVVEGEQELFRVEIEESGATLLVSRFELDFWNAAGSTLPTDDLFETIDWDRDTFWLKRLSDFKELMAARGFQFDFAAEPERIAAQQQLLISEIQKFFSLSPGNNRQAGRGLGYLACGDGEYEDTALVLTVAIQALGQQFGIRSRLWGFAKEDQMKPSFVLISTLKDGKSTEAWSELTLKHPAYKPVQRPLSEVLRKVLANGPFGKEESLILIRGSLENSVESESKAID